MYSKVRSVAVYGIEAFSVDVEVFITQGQLPSTNIVGLPDAAVKESKDRVKAAMRNSGYPFPVKIITINLAPADRRKEGPVFELPIAIALLSAVNTLESEMLDDHAVVGELGLDGQVRPVKGVLSMALEARRAGRRGMIVPEGNAQEAAVVRELDIFPVASLVDAVEFLSGVKGIEPFRIDVGEVFRKASVYDVDFAEVRGQAMAKRALEVAAAGGHNVLMIGPPGTGKSMLAQRLPSILPDLTIEESLETTRVHSVAGLIRAGQSLLARRPFRSPHHTISMAGLVGGGSHPSPGEVSLAHHGVLFLDELPEFDRRTLEVLRQPLEDGEVTISRASGTVTYPARIMLIGALNPCPCGNYGNPRKECRCTPFQIQKYRHRISGPLLDRIDIQVNVPAVPYEDLADRSPGEPSAAIRERIVQCRRVQLDRYASEKGKRRIFTNAQMTQRMLRKHCELDSEAETLLRQAMNTLALSARAYGKIKKVARTIADLDGSENISAMHLSEAVQYRSLDHAEEA